MGSRSVRLTVCKRTSINPWPRGATGETRTAYIHTGRLTFFHLSSYFSLTLSLTGPTASSDAPYEAQSWSIELDGQQFGGIPLKAALTGSFFFGRV